MVSSSLDNGEPLSFFEFERKMNNEAEGRPEEYQEMGKVSKTMEKKEEEKKETRGRRTENERGEKVGKNFNCGIFCPLSRKDN